MSERVRQIAANLWRWTTPSPHWRDGDDSKTGGWAQDVGSLLYVRDGTATIFDPLAAGVDDPELWAFLDEHAAGAGRIVVALTASWHRRSSAVVIGRYGGEIRLHRFAADDTVTRDLEHVRPFDADGEIAPGVEALLIGGYDSGEVVYWLPEHTALVSGEVFQGRPDGLRIGPDPYLVSRDALYAWIGHLDRLPVTLVLPAHGPPAPDGPDVIRRALARPPWTLPGSG
jgi:hypothetical protein